MNNTSMASIGSYLGAPATKDSKKATTSINDPISNSVFSDNLWSKDNYDPAIATKRAQASSNQLSITASLDSIQSAETAFKSALKVLMKGQDKMMMQFTDPTYDSVYVPKFGTIMKSETNPLLLQKMMGIDTDERLFYVGTIMKNMDAIKSMEQHMLNEGA